MTFASTVYKDRFFDMKECVTFSGIIKGGKCYHLVLSFMSFCRLLLSFDVIIWFYHLMLLFILCYHFLLSFPPFLLFLKMWVFPSLLLKDPCYTYYFCRGYIQIFQAVRHELVNFLFLSPSMSTTTVPP